MQFKVNKKYQCYTCEAYLRGKCLEPLYHKETLPTEDEEYNEFVYEEHYFRYDKILNKWFSDCKKEVTD